VKMKSSPWCFLEWSPSMRFLLELPDTIEYQNLSWDFLALFSTKHCRFYNILRLLDSLTMRIWNRNQEFWEHCHDAHLRCDIVFSFWSDIFVMYDVIVYPCILVVMLLARVEPCLSWLAWTKISFETFKHCPLPSIETASELSYWDLCVWNRL